MFKILTTLTLFLICASPIHADCESFYDSVLDSYTRHSAYLSLEVDSAEYSGPVIIENIQLSTFFRKTRGHDRKTYKNFMKRFFIEKKGLTLGDVDLDEWHFVKIKEPEEVSKFARDGRASFLDHYLEKGLLIKGLIKEEKGAVIARLFSWGILVYVDDETGRLIAINCSSPKA